MKSIEKFLLNKGFKLDTYYGTRKTYLLNINDYQNLYVSIYSDNNEIIQVEYEDNLISEYKDIQNITLETIDTFDKLKYLIKALT